MPPFLRPASEKFRIAVLKPMSTPRALRAVYFLYFANVGVSLPFLGPYLKGLGFDGKEIGGVHMAYQLVAIFSALAWATLADRRGAPARALHLAAVGSLLAVAWLPFVTTPIGVGLVLFVQALMTPAIVPLVDAVTVSRVKALPGGNYGRIRLWGSLGYIAAAQGIGFWLSARGDRAADPIVPWSIVAAFAGVALVSRTISQTSPRAHGVEPPHFREAVALASNAKLLGFLLLCAVHWAACAPYHLLFGVLVRDRGLSAGVTGLAMATGVAAEILALFLLPRLEGRFRPAMLLTLSFAATAVRWFLLSRATSATEVVLLQLFHGLTFGVFWGTAVRAMSELVPAHWRVTGQALFGAVVFGAGSAVGYALSGIGYDAWGGAAPLFAAAGAVELVALACAFVLAPQKGAPP